MTTQQQAYALSLSDELLKGMWVPNVLQNESALRARAAQELRRLHAENETLRAGHAAARLEIESLKERVQQLGQLARDVNSRRVVELEAQLAAVGAGGVEPLRKRECLHKISEPVQPLVCDYCGALTPDPWHSSGMLHGKMSKHIHSCDACAARGAAQSAPVDAAVQQDAERLDYLIEQRAYVVSDPSICDGYWLHYARPNGETWVQSNEHTTPRAAIDAARAERIK